MLLGILFRMQVSRVNLSVNTGSSPRLLRGVGVGKVIHVLVRHEGNSFFIADF